MNSIPQREAEAGKTYELYWGSYTSGDLETFAPTLDDNYEMIGTSESQICHSKAAGIEFYKVQMNEVVGKTAMRNRQINVLPEENLLLVNEQCEIYVLVASDLPADKAGRQDWNFYSKIRISTWLRETEEGKGSEFIFQIPINTANR
jgi:DNA helicase HerA-like ATPase